MLIIVSTLCSIRDVAVKREVNLLRATWAHQYIVRGAAWNREAHELEALLKVMTEHMMSDFIHKYILN